MLGELRPSSVCMVGLEEEGTKLRDSGHSALNTSKIFGHGIQLKMLFST